MRQETIRGVSATSNCNDDWCNAGLKRTAAPGGLVGCGGRRLRVIETALKKGNPATAIVTEQAKIASKALISLRRRSLLRLLFLKQSESTRRRRMSNMKTSETDLSDGVLYIEALRGLAVAEAAASCGIGILAETRVPDPFDSIFSVPRK